MTTLKLKDKFSHLLEESAAYHTHVCPRQVLGVRMGLYAGQLLGFEAPQADKRIFTFIETDGCFLDGVAVSTGCAAGRRTMRVVDFGKMAATFVDSLTEQAIRLSPHSGARKSCQEYAPGAQDRWHAYLVGYQEMPDNQLFQVQPVQLAVPLKVLLCREKMRSICARCGEEIFNEREVQVDGIVLCQACAGQSYYSVTDPVCKETFTRIRELSDRLDR